MFGKKNYDASHCIFLRHRCGDSVETYLLPRASSRKKAQVVIYLREVDRLRTAACSVDRPTPSSMYERSDKYLTSLRVGSGPFTYIRSACFSHHAKSESRDHTRHKTTPGQRQKKKHFLCSHQMHESFKKMQRNLSTKRRNKPTSPCRYIVGTDERKICQLICTRIYVCAQTLRSSSFRA